MASGNDQAGVLPVLPGLEPPCAVAEAAGAAVAVDVGADVATGFGEFAAQSSFEPFGAQAEHLASHTR